MNLKYIVLLIVFVSSCKSNVVLIDETESFKWNPTLKDYESAEDPAGIDSLSLRFEIANYTFKGVKTEVDSVFGFALEEQTKFIQVDEQFAFKIFYARTKEFNVTKHLGKVLLFFKIEEEWRTTIDYAQYDVLREFDPRDLFYNGLFTSGSTEIKYKLNIKNNVR